MKQKILTEKYFASAAEADPEQKLALTALVTKIIDIATSHANSLGIGNPSMEHLNAGWVLSRLTVEMERYPAVNQDYTLHTWVEGWNRHFSQRAFRVDDMDGNPIGYARSIWMVLNKATREGVSLEHLDFDTSLIDNGMQCPISRQARHIPIVATSGEDLPKGALIAAAPPRPYTFKYCDLDSYRHVNTVRYLTMLLNQFSLEDFDAAFVKRLEMSFLHEARYGMPVEIMRHDRAPEGDVSQSSFSLVEKESGTPLLFARLVMQRR